MYTKIVESLVDVEASIVIISLEIKASWDCVQDSIMEQITI